MLIGAVLPAQDHTPEPERSVAAIDSLSVTVLETFPAQAQVELVGWLPDACTEIELVEETTVPPEKRVELEVATVRDPGLACAQAIEGFRLQVRLDIFGFAEGSYVVAAGGHEADFEIEPIGDFPALSLPAVTSESRIIVPEAQLALIPPTDWSRTGLVWDSPSYLGARIGLRWHGGEENPLELLPAAAELHESSESRLGWATGLRFRVSRGPKQTWSEHLFVPCNTDRLCEFWMEAPSDPLLDAAGEAFWRLVRFVARLPT